MHQNHPDIIFLKTRQVGELFETYVDAPGLSINKPAPAPPALARAARSSDSRAHGESAVGSAGGYRQACSSGPDA